MMGGLWRVYKEGDQPLWGSGRRMQTQIWLLEVLETLSPEDWALSEDMDRSLRFLFTLV